MNARIALTDDHQIILDGLGSVLDKIESFEVLLKTTSGINLFAELDKGIAIDVLFLDLDMPEMDGLETLKRLKRNHPDVHVVILSLHEDESIILHSIEHGASGYLLKNSSVKQLKAAVNEVQLHGYYFEDFIVNIMRKGLFVKTENPFSPENILSLSKREMEVLDLLCKEHTASEISEKLFVSQRTVEGHKRKLLEKINSRNTAGLILNCLKLGHIRLENV